MVRISAVINSLNSQGRPVRHGLERVVNIRPKEDTVGIFIPLLALRRLKEPSALTALCQTTPKSSYARSCLTATF